MPGRGIEVPLAGSFFHVLGWLGNSWGAPVVAFPRARGSGAPPSAPAGGRGPGGRHSARGRGRERGGCAATACGAGNRVAVARKERASASAGARTVARRRCRPARRRRGRRTPTRCARPRPRASGRPALPSPVGTGRVAGAGLSLLRRQHTRGGSGSAELRTRARLRGSRPLTARTTASPRRCARHVHCVCVRTHKDVCAPASALDGSRKIEL